jgi:acylphosphatase
VQGVGFRAFVRREARSLGVDGWVRNAADGSVEAEGAADRATLEAFEERLRQGPPAGRVSELEVRELAADGEAEPAGAGFEIRF